MNRQKKIDTLWLTQCGILLLLEILFLTVPFLQIELGAFTIVFSAMPIAIAAIVLGFRATSILGCAWGLISFSQAFTDAFGVVMLETNFFGTFIVLGLSRVLVGVFTFAVFKFLPKSEQFPRFNVMLTCFAASVFNNLFFWGWTCTFFQRHVYGVYLSDSRRFHTL